MADAGIFFDRVWKKFRRGDNLDSLTETLMGLFKRRRLDPDALKRQEFWAVRDVSFEVRPGEALGIIGPNGAGKSTILKLLTRILRPTRGQCALRGRVGSLIEISAGFHGDLSGRENIFLQGAIVGMKRQEIRERFDDIVDFSGISEFIDTPVRRYSSGMNARLGFSIAAHVNPDVLIIDEVLAVGDFVFQQKAFGRIQDMVNRDVAAVLVSHQLERVSQLCKRTLVLSAGQVLFDGPSHDAIATYVADVGERLDETRNVPIAIDEISLIEGAIVKPGGEVTVRVAGRVLQPDKVEQTSGVGIRLRSLQNAQVVFGTATARLGIELPLEGSFELEVKLHMNVAPGVYSIETALHDRMLGKSIATGPRVSVTVGADPSFVGRAYVAPSVRLIPRASQLMPAGLIR